MAGRRPNVVHNRLKEGLSKEELKDIENSTPVYESQNFEPPKTLSSRERKIWDWLVGIFRETTNCMVSDADVQLMELYCKAKADAEEADEALKKDNRAYIPMLCGVDANGKPKTTLKANPNIKKKHDSALLCLKFFDQLGLSPLARARVGIKGANKKKEENIWQELMEREDEE